MYRFTSILPKFDSKNPEKCFNELIHILEGELIKIQKSVGISEIKSIVNSIAIPSSGSSISEDRLRAGVIEITTEGTDVILNPPYNDEQYIIIPEWCIASSGMKLSVDIISQSYDKFRIKSWDEPGVLKWVTVKY